MGRELRSPSAEEFAVQQLSVAVEGYGWSETLLSNSKLCCGGAASALRLH